MAGNRDRGPIDELLDAMSDRRRRYAVAYMHSSDDDVFQLDDIARLIVTQDAELSDVSENQRERVNVALRHRHFPKLDEAGLVEFDFENGVVRYRGLPESDTPNMSKLGEIMDEIAAEIDQ